MDYYIEQINLISEDLILALNKLLKLLDDKAKYLTKIDIENIISSKTNYLFVAKNKENKEIIGMISLLIYQIPVGKKGWLEDLVVDENFRNKGIATKLIMHAMEKAKAEGVLTLNFTSQPNKEDANKLYEKLGFEKRNTNVYRINL